MLIESEDETKLDSQTASDQDQSEKLRQGALKKCLKQLWAKMKNK